MKTRDRGTFAIRSLRNQGSGERPVRFGVVDFRSAHMWVSPVMHYATTLSDVTSVTRRIFCPVRDRHAAFRTPIISVETLLVAAAIAASVTFGIEWMHTAYLKADSNLKAEENCCAFRSVPASAGSLFDSPFAHGNALLFLSEPVGSYASRQEQVSSGET